MKPIGQSLTIVREARKMGLLDLSQETRIKVEFLEALENERWEDLPELPILIGFVKNIADALVVLLRRDYKKPESDVSVSRKSIKRLKIPRLPQYVYFVVLVVVVSLSYLIYQYVSFNTPPDISIISPISGQVVGGDTVIVRGVTDPSASVVINTQPSIVNEDGSFEVEVVVSATSSTVQVVARSRSGLETTKTIELSKQ
jgi:cytoskeletal protein RodZ